jgi:hypothetical protein
MWSRTSTLQLEIKGGLSWRFTHWSPLLKIRFLSNINYNFFPVQSVQKSFKSQPEYNLKSRTNIDTVRGYQARIVNPVIIYTEETIFVIHACMPKHMHVSECRYERETDPMLKQNPS